MSFQGQFGSVGAEDGRFVWPRSIDLDDHGRVFVSDEHLNRISIYDEEGGYRYSLGQVRQRRRAAERTVRNCY